MIKLQINTSKIRLIPIKKCVDPLLCLGVDPAKYSRSWLLARSYLCVPASSAPVQDYSGL